MLELSALSAAGSVSWERGLQFNAAVSHKHASNRRPKKKQLRVLNHKRPSPRMFFTVQRRLGVRGGLNLRTNLLIVDMLPGQKCL